MHAPQVIKRLAQGADHAAQQLLAHRNRQHLACAVGPHADGGLRVIAKKHRAYAVLLQVHDDGIGARVKLEQLV